ncbi:dienelactone hydrolase family protein [bacterium]|nr:dienelactone hydrolase family protein [bacterium]
MKAKLPISERFLYSLIVLNALILPASVPAASEVLPGSEPAAGHGQVQAESACRIDKTFVKDGVEIEHWTYKSDGLSVKGRLYLPCRREGRLPLIIFSHDGISGISSSHELSCLRLALKGYAVFAPSYRGEDGSDGMIEIAKGEVSDVLNALSILKKHRAIDEDRVFLMGASHGALISLLAAGRLPANSLKGLIFAYGVADVYRWWDHLIATRQLGKDPITRRTYGDGPQVRPESFRIRCGLNAVGNIDAPVLIMQGKLDTITPPEQAQYLKEALDEQGKEAQLKMYPNCLHGFLVYAPYLKSGVTPQERRETETAWNDLFEFLEQNR